MMRRYFYILIALLMTSCLNSGSTVEDSHTPGLNSGGSSGGDSGGGGGSGTTASAANSTVSASATHGVADNATTVTITVTLKDATSAVVQGKTVTLSSSRGATDTISPASATSDVNGQATFTVKTATVGIPVVTATDSTDSVVVTQTATIYFGCTTGKQVVAASGTTVFAVPSPCTDIFVKAWGAGGGGGGGGNAGATGTGGLGGGGGFASGTLSVTAGENLDIVVGTGGSQGLQGAWPSAAGAGGASAVLRAATRLLVAGGGGGGGAGGASNLNESGKCGGHGGPGGTTGTSGDNGTSGCVGGSGATQAAVGTGGACGNGNGSDGATAAAGGAGGTGGTHATDTPLGGTGGAGSGAGGDGGRGNWSGGGGGGGGYFGGGGGGRGNCGGGGGGGSSYNSGSNSTYDTGKVKNPAMMEDFDYSAGAGLGGTGGITNNDGTAGSAGRVVVYYGVASIKPPAPATMDDGTSSLTSATPSLTWSSVSFAVSYQVAVGSTSGGTDILNWTDVGNVTTTSITGITLVDTNTYYASVRAVDPFGNNSDATVGDGFTASTVNCSASPQNITATGTTNVVVPAGCTTAYFKVWGAGGGGSGGTATLAGGAGGGGAYCGGVLSLTPGETIDVIVAASGGGSKTED